MPYVIPEEQAADLGNEDQGLIQDYYQDDFNE